MADLYLKRTKDGSPDRLILKCDYSEKELAKEAGRGTASYNKREKGWSFPLDPAIAKNIVRYFPKINVKSDLISYLNAKREKQKLIIEATGDYREIHNPDLWGFQRASVRFLAEAKRAVLGHEMGTGKTPIACSATDFLGIERIMIVCPNSVKWSWVSHMKEWAGREDCWVVETSKPKGLSNDRVIHGSPRDRSEGTEKILFKSGPVVLIVNYDQVRIHQKILSQFDFDAVIVDEAHRIKNRKAQRSQAVNEIAKRTEYLWLLTGTPIRNCHSDLFMLLHLCDPKRFHGYWNFVNFYLTSVKNPFGGVDIIGPRDEEEFGRMLSTYMFRVTKSQAMPELPDKIYSDRAIPMTKAQEEDYERMEKELVLMVNDIVKEGTQEEWQEVLKAENIISKIMRLRQICLSPAIVGGRNSSAKLDALNDLIEDLCYDDKQVIVFSYFKPFVEKVEELISAKGVSCDKIVGGQTSQERQEVIDKLNRKEVQVVVATAKSGGEGVNLQSADTAIFTDIDWVPANNEQAEDRIHRGEIKESPTIIRFYHPNTVEDDIRAVCRRKSRKTDATTGIVETLRRTIARR